MVKWQPKTSVIQGEVRQQLGLYRRKSLSTIFAYLIFPLCTIAAPEIHIGDASGLPGNDVDLSVDYLGDNSVTAIQMDLEFNPSSASPNEATGSTALDDHVVLSNLIVDGKYRLVIYSPTNSLLNDGNLSDVLFSLDDNFSGQSEVTVTNIRSVDAEGTVISPTAISPGSLRALLEFLLKLFPGWNSFSLPIDPMPAQVAQIFNLEKPIKVWELIQEQGVSKLSQVATLESKHGYWVYFPEPMDIEVGGEQSTDHTVPISAGWSIIGVAEETDYPANPEIDGNIWTWDGEKQRFQIVKPGEKLVPGVGYWVHADSDLTLFSE